MLIAIDSKNKSIPKYFQFASPGHHSHCHQRLRSLNIIIIFIVLVHIGLLIFGLFHAIWGQYFYVPFFVENTELHIGPRPKNSIYSGGNTSWQDPEEKEQHLQEASVLV